MTRQRRGTISINCGVYEQMEVECKRRGLSISSVVTRFVDEIDEITASKIATIPRARIDTGIVDDRKSPTVDISAVVSPRVRELLSIHAARIRRHHHMTGQIIAGITDDEMLEVIIKGALKLLSEDATGAKR